MIKTNRYTDDSEVFSLVVVKDGKPWVGFSCVNRDAPK